MSTTTVRRFLLLLVVPLLAAACGVPNDPQPKAIKPDDVPFELLAPTAGATSTTMPPQFVATTHISIYLADADGHLVATQREVRAPATVTGVIRALLAGPATDEGDRLHTAITSDTNLRHISGPRQGLVTIDLSRQFLDITGRQQILALAQVVYTATSLSSIDRVRFEFDGAKHEVPDGDGTLTSSPLGRLSYRGLVGPA